VDRSPPLLSRIRWGNVARVLALVALAVVIGAWPRLRDGEPALPSDHAEPVVPSVPAPPSPPARTVPAPDEEAGVSATRRAAVQRRGRAAARAKAARRRAAKMRRREAAPSPPAPAPPPVSPPPRATPPPAGAGGEFGF
jgi:hypothetical protein